MHQDLSIAYRFLPHIAEGPADRILDSDHLTIEKDGGLRVAYAPFDDVATGARLVLVGITPGRTQAVTALRAAHSAMAQGLPKPQVLRDAKLKASFSGAMRDNLTSMIDTIGLPRLLCLEAAEDIFRPGGELVHLTSALRYPVFRDGANYNGAPDMIRTPMLRRMIETHLAEEVRLLPKALWLPLGPKPAQALAHLAKHGMLDRQRILAGLPHPSGANGERIAVFTGRKAPEDASRQTKGFAIAAVRDALITQIETLSGDFA